MKCPKCGCEVEEKSSFCDKCLYTFKQEETSEESLQTEDEFDETFETVVRDEDSIDYEVTNDFFFLQEPKLEPYTIGTIVGFIIVFLSFYFFFSGSEGGGLFLFLLGTVTVVCCIVYRSHLIDEYAKSYVTGAAYDKEVIKGFFNLKERALDKFGLVEEEVMEVRPIVFTSYDYTHMNHLRIREDKQIRTDVCNAVLIFFSQNELYYYKFSFSTIDPKNFSETTEVLFYKDVVSVSTSTEAGEYQGIKFNYELFRLTTSGGTSFSVSFKNVEDMQESIKAMRNLLREKKNNN